MILSNTILPSWDYFLFWLMMGRKGKLKRVFHFRVGETVKLKEWGVIPWKEENNSHGLPAKRWLKSQIDHPELDCLLTILIWTGSKYQAIQETLSDPPTEDLCHSASEAPPPYMGIRHDLDRCDSDLEKKTFPRCPLTRPLNPSFT